MMFCFRDSSENAKGTSKKFLKPSKVILHLQSFLFSVKRGQSPDAVTPPLNSRKPEGKMKLRDKRMMKLKVERRKISDKSIGQGHDVSPTLKQRMRSNAATPTKVRF